jgi:hypothetical protein
VSWPRRMPSKRAWIVRKFGVAVRGRRGLGSTRPSWSRRPVDPPARGSLTTSGKAKSCVIDGGNQCANKTRKSSAEAGPAGMNRVRPAWFRPELIQESCRTCLTRNSLAKCAPVECTAFGVHGHAGAGGPGPQRTIPARGRGLPISGRRRHGALVHPPWPCGSRSFRRDLVPPA